jgi:hypothetical protein
MDELQHRLACVGRVCIEWATLEYHLANAIWFLVDLDKPTGRIVTGGLDMLPRLNMAINLARHKRADKLLISALVDAREAIQGGLDTRRNRAVHGLQFTDGGVYTVEVHRGKGGRDRQDLTTAELESLGEEIHQLELSFASVLVSVMAKKIRP